MAPLNMPVLEGMTLLALIFQALPMKDDVCLLYLTVYSRLNSINRPKKLLMFEQLICICALKCTKLNKKPSGTHDSTFDWQTS